MSSDHAEIVRRLRAACRRDPAKASVCGGLAVVLLVMWGRVLVHAGPATAAARPTTTVPAVVVAARPRSTSEKAVLRWLTGPKAAVTRDLFDWPVASRDDSAGREAKSAAAAADVERRKVAEAAVRQRLGDLHLASTVLGGRPRAVVDGELVEVGDVVAGFTVVRIEARRIVVRDGDVEATVDMD